MMLFLTVRKTFRSLIHDHVDRNSWGGFGIDIALGSVIDKDASPYEHMYLPKYIFSFFETATRKNSDKLVEQTKVIYKKKEFNMSKTWLFSPLAVFGLLSIIIISITYFDHKKKRRSKWLDVVLFTFTGLIGVLIILLWFATNHSATAQNYNLLWAFPLNLLLIAQLFKKKIKNWFKRYLKFLVIILCLMILHWIIGIQVYAIGLIPLLIALFIRYVYLVKFYNSSEIIN